MQRFRFNTATEDVKIQLLELSYLCGATYDFVLLEMAKKDERTCPGVLDYLKSRLTREEDMLMDFFVNCGKCMRSKTEEVRERYSKIMRRW